MVSDAYLREAPPHSTPSHPLPRCIQGQCLVSTAEQSRRAVFTWALARGMVELRLDGALHYLLDGDMEQVDVHLAAEVVRVASGA